MVVEDRQTPNRTAVQVRISGQLRRRVPTNMGFRSKSPLLNAE